MRNATLLAVVLLGWVGRGSGAVVHEIPFQFVDGLIRVEVRCAASSKPLWFLLDSGAAVSVLSASTAERLGLRDGERVTVSGVGGQTHGRWPQRLSLSASGVRLASRYLVVDLCELEESCAGPVDGLIGADFFEDHTVQVDFTGRVVRLLSRSGKAATDMTGYTIPFRQSRGVWTVEACINSVKSQRLRVDTGCATGLHWANQAAANTPGNASRSVGLAAFSAATAECDLRLGPCAVGRVPAALHANRIFAGEDGLLGNAFLTRFGVVTFDTRSGRLLLGR